MPVGEDIGADTVSYGSGAVKAQIPAGAQHRGISAVRRQIDAVVPCGQSDMVDECMREFAPLKILHGKHVSDMARFLFRIVLHIHIGYQLFVVKDAERLIGIEPQALQRHVAGQFPRPAFLEQEEAVLHLLVRLQYAAAWVILTDRTGDAAGCRSTPVTGGLGMSAVRACVRAATVLVRSGDRTERVAACQAQSVQDESIFHFADLDNDLVRITGPIFQLGGSERVPLAAFDRKVGGVRSDFLQVSVDLCQIRIWLAGFIEQIGAADINRIGHLFSRERGVFAFEQIVNAHVRTGQILACGREKSRMLFCLTELFGWVGTGRTAVKQHLCTLGIVEIPEIADCTFEEGLPDRTEQFLEPVYRPEIFLCTFLTERQPEQQVLVPFTCVDIQRGNILADQQFVVQHGEKAAEILAFGLAFAQVLEQYFSFFQRQCSGVIRNSHVGIVGDRLFSTNRPAAVDQFCKTLLDEGNIRTVRDKQLLGQSGGVSQRQDGTKAENAV